MKYGTGRRQGAKPEPASFWICFSDLMSALLLLFVLVLFYSAYQYFDMLEIKTAELTRQSGLLDEQEAQLSLSQQALEEKQALLNDQGLKLTEAEQALIGQKAKLLLQQDSLDALQAKLAEQQAQLAQAEQGLQTATQSQIEQKAMLDQQQALLASQQQLLDDQQAQLQAQQHTLKTQEDKLSSQQSQLTEQRQQLEKLVGVRAEIISRLIGALSAKNITGARVDASGAIVFDSEMMFDKNKSVLKDEGKAFLSAFIPGYLDVLLSDESRPFVSQIIVEGHTDTDGSFALNMNLSQQRAGAVLNYILSDDFTAITQLAKRRLREIITVNGRAYNDPVYDAAGRVDKDASRRVVIKFRLNDEDMVNDMIELLGGM
ncbi:MAG: OmpA family protein [Clostridiales bacterium]|nr:OmpA family protein [Clostridiales bacterium]